jgi:hypothetical protein
LRATAKIPGYRVLTDLTGEFNRVILEYETENIAGFEAQMKDYATNEKFREKMKGLYGFAQTSAVDVFACMKCYVQFQAFRWGAAREST